MTITHDNDSLVENEKLRVAVLMRVWSAYLHYARNDLVEFDTLLAACDGGERVFGGEEQFERLGQPHPVHQERTRQQRRFLGLALVNHYMTPFGSSYPGLGKDLGKKVHKTFNDEVVGGYLATLSDRQRFVHDLAEKLRHKHAAHIDLGHVDITVAPGAAIGGGTTIDEIPDAFFVEMVGLLGEIKSFLGDELTRRAGQLEEGETHEDKVYRNKEARAPLCCQRDEGTGKPCGSHYECWPTCAFQRLDAS